MTPQKLVSLLIKKGLTLSVAESCTGGLICHKLTTIPGVSKVFKEGIICYSNSSKVKRLGIKKDIIEKYGAVSPEICRLMAKNIVKSEKTDLGISVTGIAGPSGGTIDRLVGLIYIGINIKGRVTVRKYNFRGNRKTIQQKSASTALELLKSALSAY